jgi:AmpD protein
MARAPVWTGGWFREAQALPSPNEGPRPPGAVVDLAVVHSISLPPGHYGGDAIERLFTNQLDFDAHPYYAAIRGLKVSAHFLVRRDGRLLQFVATGRRAWHAGASSWRGLPDCNDRSIGIELEGLEDTPFEPVQYEGLARVLRSLSHQHPIAEVVGHEHIAPGRKRDPGAAFAWDRLIALTRWRADRFAPYIIPWADTSA